MAILAADVAGYSRLTDLDEEGTHRYLQDHLRSLVEPKIAEYRGRVVKNTGDGLLAEFPSGLTFCVAGSTVNEQGLPEMIRGAARRYLSGLPAWDTRHNRRHPGKIRAGHVAHSGASGETITR